MIEIKSLKQEGVPFGARIIFRLQHLVMVCMCIGFLLSLPLVFIWAFFHPSGKDFIDGVNDVLEKRLCEIKSHRQRVIDLYRSAP